MTALLATALGLLVLSALTLVLGWVGANEILIWVSILASVGVAICLALAYHRSRSGSGRRARSGS